MSDDCLSMPRTGETPAEEASEPCPPSRPWQQVLAEVQTESEQWTLTRGRALISGKTFGHGPPLYFLNGMGGTHELYALLAWLLREDFRCVMFDAAGSQTGHSAPAATLKDLVDDLFAAADRHGDDRFSVYAHSFGSLIALSAMRQMPRRIVRAVLQSGFAYRRLTTFERALIALARYVPGSLAGVPFREAIQRQSHAGWFPSFDLARWEFFTQNTGSVPVRALAARAAIVVKTDLRPQLADIRQRVLLVQCEGDGRVESQCQDELTRALPDVRVERIAGSGQLPFLTHPHRLRQLVVPFLSGEPSDTHAAAEMRCSGPEASQT